MKKVKEALALLRAVADSDEASPERSKARRMLAAHYGTGAKAKAASSRATAPVTGYTQAQLNAIRTAARQADEYDDLKIRMGLAPDRPRSRVRFFDGGVGREVTYGGGESK